MNQPSQPAKPRLLITGAGGVIGTRIVSYFKPHYELVLTDLVPGEIDDVPVQTLDITDMARTCEAMQGIDYVVHLAIGKISAMQHIPEDPRNDTMMNVNVLGTQHVFEAARRHGVKRVAFASSMTVYTGKPRLPQVDASTPVRPANLYACTKLFGEHLAELYAREFDLPIICLRLGQPIPVPGKLSYTVLKERPKRVGLAVAYEDIAAALLDALRDTSPRFARVNVFSASDQTRFERTGAESIGFTPKVFFTPDGPVPHQPVSETGS